MKYLKTDKKHLEIDFEEDEELTIIYNDPTYNILIFFTSYQEDLDNWELYLNQMKSQNNPDKPRAPKGLTRKILCELIEYLIDKSWIGEEWTITLRTGDIGGTSERRHNIRALERMYEKMGFVEDFSGKFKQSVESFLEWCKLQPARIPFGKMEEKRELVKQLKEKKKYYNKLI